MTLLRSALILACITGALITGPAVGQQRLAAEQKTENQYLSGTGYGDTVEWEFMVDGGRRAGEWATIGVPSQLGLEGFGTYNYGHDADSIRGKERGFTATAFRHRQCGRTEPWTSYSTAQ